ncbi:hypothetical protein ACLB2K_016851 [Fragaria x ananassa]
MAESSGLIEVSRSTLEDQRGLGEERTLRTAARSEVSGERHECTPVGNDRARTPDETMHDLTQEEVEDMVERLRANVARLERESTRDCLEASTREKKLERDNATIVSSLERRLESGEAIEWAAATLRNQQAEGRESPITLPPASRRTVHVGVNLFPEGMENEHPPPLPTLGGRGGPISLSR